jgi:hypothetical protein
MTAEQVNKMRTIFDKAEADGDFVKGTASGPLDQLLVAVAALEASTEDPIGVSEDDFPEVDRMMVRLLEIYTGEKL